MAARAANRAPIRAAPRTPQRLAHVGRHLPAPCPSAVLSAILPAEALHHHHIGDALPDLVAFDETAIVDLQIGLLEPGVRLAHLLDALDVLHADVEQADARALDVKQRPRHGRAHQSIVGELARGGADVGAEIETQCRLC